MVGRPAGLQLATQAEAAGGAAFDSLAGRFPSTTDCDERQATSTREDLVFIVQFLAAAMLVGDPAVCAEFLS